MVSKSGAPARCILSALLIFGGLVKAHADTVAANPEIHPMTLAVMIEALRQQNPQMEQARQNYQAAKALGPQQRAPNNPQFGVVNNPIPRNPLNLGQSEFFYYTVTQSFPFWGKKSLAGDIADEQAETSNTQIETTYLQLLAQLKSNFYQVLLLERQMEINREGIQRLEQIKQLTKVRYAQNAAAFVDFLNAQVAQSSAENDQFALQKQADTVRETLNTLIGRDPQTPLSVNGELPPQGLPATSLSDIEGMALEHNPAIRGSEHEVKASERGVDLAKLGYFPDFQVVLYGNSGNSGNPGNPNPPSPLAVTSTNSWGLEFDIVVPLWFYTKERYGVQQARATLSATQASDVALRQQTRLAADAAYNALAQAVAQGQFIRARQLPESQTAYRLALTNYSSGGVNFLDLLTAQSNLRSAQLALAQSDVGAIQAYANLVTAVGSEVP